MCPIMLKHPFLNPQITQPYKALFCHAVHELSLVICTTGRFLAYTRVQAVGSITCKRTTWEGTAWQPWGSWGSLHGAWAPGWPQSPATQPIAPRNCLALRFSWSPAPAGVPLNLHTDTPMMPVPVNIHQPMECTLSKMNRQHGNWNHRLYSLTLQICAHHKYTITNPYKRVHTFHISSCTDPFHKK